MHETGEATGAGQRSSAVSALAILTLILVICNIDRMIIAILFDLIKAEFALMDWQLGLLSGLAFSTFYGVGSLWIARLAERRDRVTILAVCVGAWSALTVACGLAVSYAQLLVLRMGVGLAESGCQPASHSLIADFFDEDRRPVATGVYAAGALAGSLVALPLGGWLAGHVGWRGALIAAGIPGILLALLLRGMIRDPRFDARRARDVTESEPAGAAFRSVFAGAASRNIIFGAVLYAIASAAFLSFGPSFLIRKFGISALDAGLYFGLLAGLPAVASNIFVGWLVARLARRRRAWLQWIPALAAAAGVGPTLVFLLAPDLSWALAALFVQSALSVVWLGPSIAAIQSAVTPARRATGAACLVASYTVIGFGLGPLFAGLLSDYLARSLGALALGGGLIALQPFALWAAFHFFRAGTALGPADREDEEACARS
jgi:MFS family permease